VLHTILVGTAAASVCTIAANVRDVAAVTTRLQSHSSMMRSTMDVGHSLTECHTLRHMTLNLLVFLPSIQHVMMCGEVSQSEREGKFVHVREGKCIEAV